MTAPLRATNRVPHFSWLASVFLNGILFAAAATISIFPRSQGIAEADGFETSGSLFVDIDELPPTVEPPYEIEIAEPPFRNASVDVEISTPSFLPPQPTWAESDSVIVLVNPFIAAPSFAVASEPIRSAKKSEKTGSKMATKATSRAGSTDENAVASNAPPVVFHRPQRIGGAIPMYPVGAKKAGVTGTVLILVTLSETGRMEGVSISKSSGNAELDQEALRAVRTWRFRPAMRGEQPVAHKITVPVRFGMS